jgi:hypothetical protein
MRKHETHVENWCTPAPRWCHLSWQLPYRWALLPALFWVGQSAFAVTLAEIAKQSGCVNRPVAMSGSLYKCSTSSGVEAFFNVPGATESPAPVSSGTKASATPTPSGFQRVDPATQKGRDDVRRKVLGEELATEEQLLAEARTAYNNGAPAPLPEESSNAEKYRERIARYRQAVQLHERNIEALKKELGSSK